MPIRLPIFTLSTIPSVRVMKRRSTVHGAAVEPIEKDLVRAEGRMGLKNDQSALPSRAPTSTRRSNMSGERFIFIH